MDTSQDFTPDLCDNHPDQVRILTPIFRSYGRVERFHGPVVTVRCFEDNSRVKEQLATPGNGRVLVVDGAGSLRKALMGDLIAASAVDNGWAGVVIHGAIRDVSEIDAMAIGVRALGSIPLRTDRRDLGEVDVPVAFAGAEIRPGDYLYADRTGIVVAAQSLHGA